MLYLINPNVTLGAGNVGKQTFKSPFRKVLTAKPQAKFVYGQPAKKIVTESPTSSNNSSNNINGKKLY